MEKLTSLNAFARARRECSDHLSAGAFRFALHHPLDLQQLAANHHPDEILLRDFARQLRADVFAIARWSLDWPAEKSLPVDD